MQDPDDETFQWELDRLEKECGLSYVEALEAIRAGLSWHDLYGLIVNGASPQQALSILL